MYIEKYFSHFGEQDQWTLGITYYGNICAWCTFNSNSSLNVCLALARRYQSNHENTGIALNESKYSRHHLSDPFILSQPHIEIHMYLPAIAILMIAYTFLHLKRDRVMWYVRANSCRHDHPRGGINILKLCTKLSKTKWIIKEFKRN